jgi:hypothetical protein
MKGEAQHQKLADAIDEAEKSFQITKRKIERATI